MHRPLGHPLGRLLAASSLAAATVLACAGAASAHVTITPTTAEQGGRVTLTFKVPDESDAASTTRLEVAIPEDAGVTSVRFKPVPGWSHDITMSGDVVTGVTWTATGPGVQPNEYEEFGLSLSPLPTSDSLALKAVQTYSDGEVSRWIDDTVAGQPEPEHPAPVLTLTPAGADEAADTDGDGPDEAPVAASDDSDSKAPLVLSIVALVVAVAGAGTALLRRRS